MPTLNDRRINETWTECGRCAAFFPISSNDLIFMSMMLCVALVGGSLIVSGAIENAAMHCVPVSPETP